LAACVSWQTQEGSPQQVLADEQPDSLRVTLYDGSRVVLGEPVVSGDSLTGSADGQQRSIPLSQVRELDIRGVSAGKTALAAVGLLVFAAGLGIAIMCAGPSETC
jgi:hypothetical protein